MKPKYVNARTVYTPKALGDARFVRAGATQRGRSRHLGSVIVPAYVRRVGDSPHLRSEKERAEIRGGPLKIRVGPPHIPPRERPHACAPHLHTHGAAREALKVFRLNDSEGARSATQVFRLNDSATNLLPVKCARAFSFRVEVAEVAGSSVPNSYGEVYGDGAYRRREIYRLLPTILYFYIIMLPCYLRRTTAVLMPTRG